MIINKNVYIHYQPVIFVRLCIYNALFIYFVSNPGQNITDHGRVIFTQGIYKGLKPWETNINQFNTSTSNNDLVNNSSEISKNIDEKITKSIMDGSVIV